MIGRMFPEHVERSFSVDPEYSFDEYFQLGSRRKVRPVTEEPTSFAEYFQLRSRTNIHPIKNGINAVYNNGSST